MRRNIKSSLQVKLLILLFTKLAYNEISPAGTIVKTCAVFIEDEKTW